MRRTLSAAALLALMIPTMGRADDTDNEKEIARLSQQAIDAEVKADTTTLDALLVLCHSLILGYTDLSL